MTHTPFDRILELVTPAVRETPATRLRPEAFFVARAGVLTLAYQGFPAPILALKKEMERVLPGLPVENPGSQWPKTTLAALVSGSPLTAEEIVLLKEATDAGAVCLSREWSSVEVDSLVLVELKCRSMERTGRREAIRLAGRADWGRVPRAHRSAVNAVLGQWRREGLSGYVTALNRAGHRERHYRSAHRELSLVIPLGHPVPCLEGFRAAVEDRLPGRYAWFAPESLHVTVRSLGSAPAP